ncbi:hypothetical protein [Plantactinospora sp. KBS50]|uniref:hypothetical protein n=1 Tax=Plantactinospora sp. KBS50 TaxID=2024580 RepID=UPI000BAB1009|nr:hypothetical protein [Plantactinospora sp. KBS50]ASW57145.1 hypothetical protein CIK06_27880 [Plantactinospora sp. KBS50]
MLANARKDRYCPPGRTPGNPAVLVATGDSITSAHLQMRYAFPMGACRGNTSADFRDLPGNDMMFSYAGKYVANLNRNVVEYYNFARTGMGTTQIRGAGRNDKDSCYNLWARSWPPADLAARAIEQAKTEHKAAYFVTTGGVNNTNWTDVLKSLVMCGTLDHYKELIQAYFAKNRLPLQATMGWYDRAGNYAAKSAVINGGACQIRLDGDVTGIRYLHKRFEVPVWDGPAHFNQIQNDVRAIVNQMLDAGADKVVWMGYYDITPARFDVGLFAETYRLALDEKMRGYLPGQIPSQERDLIDDPGWKTTVQQWTQQINAAILAALPAHQRVRFSPPPTLGFGQIQKTALGGCPHPNEPGQTALANALNATFN